MDIDGHHNNYCSGTLNTHFLKNVNHIILIVMNVYLIFDSGTINHFRAHLATFCSSLSSDIENGLKEYDVQRATRSSNCV